MNHRVSRDNGDAGMKFIRSIGKAARRSVATMTEAQAGCAVIGSAAAITALAAVLVSV